MKFYLEQLINVLHDSDIERLQNMNLKKSKIKTFLDMLISYRKEGLPEQQVFLNKLNLDENSYRKMKTILR